MTKVSELAESILSKKYYQDGETKPEDVFLRVAEVMAIPDVVDVLIEDIGSPKSKESDHTCGSFLYVFGKYQDIFLRALDRRGKELGWAHTLKNVPLVPSCNYKKLLKEKAKSYYEIISNLDFMPATPVLMNAGKEGKRGMLSSCFFLNIEDSLLDIFDKVKDVAWISKLGGSVGLDVSNLRPEGFPVKGTKGNSSGPISFLRVFNETGNTVEQGGARRAALLAAMSIYHPDIVKFIKAKKEEGQLKNFNISILVPNTFMNTLRTEPHKLFVAKFASKEFCIEKKSGKPVSHNDINCAQDPDFETCSGASFYSYQELWDFIIKNAWGNGEPGIIFDDHIQHSDVFNGKYGKLLVNPCAELPLLDGESCNLGAINLSNMYDEGNNEVDYEKLGVVVRQGVNFLDNTLDVNYFPLERIEESSLRGRKIGLGTMGLHDLMLKLRIKYGSEESLSLISEIYKFIRKTAIQESEKLAERRGIPKALEEIGSQRRNSGLLTVQPTGTVSIISGCSSGIEPNFKWEYPRKDSYGAHTIRHWILDSLPDENKNPDWLVSALEILPEEHIKVQAEVQKHIDLSIAKTINLPNDATPEDISKAYLLAYDLGCKSTTVYRTGSREEEVLCSEEKHKKQEDDVIEITPQPTMRRERPPVLFGATYRVKTPGGTAYITINEDDDGVRECFISVSKAGSEIGSHVASQGRLISNSLQWNVPIHTIINHLKGQKSSPVWADGELINSVPDAVARKLEHFIQNFEGFSEFIDKTNKCAIIEDADKGSPSGELCPECGEVLYMESGCNICKSCGHSRCGG